MHEVLIAPWDFPIYKSEAELNREHDSILQSFKPFFDYDTAKYIRELNSFYSYYNELRVNRTGTEKDLSLVDYERIRSVIGEILASAYSTGIYVVDDMASELRQNDKDVILIKGTIAEEVKFASMLSLKEASERVENAKDNQLLNIDQTIDLRVFEFISTISLFDFVKQNIEYNSEVTGSEREKLLNNVSLTRGLIQNGELII